MSELMQAILEVEAGAGVRETAKKYDINPTFLSHACIVARELQNDAKYCLNSSSQTPTSAKPFCEAPKFAQPDVDPCINRPSESIKSAKRPTSAPQRQRPSANPCLYSSSRTPETWYFSKKFVDKLERAYWIFLAVVVAGLAVYICR